MRECRLVASSSRTALSPGTLGRAPLSGGLAGHETRALSLGRIAGRDRSTSGQDEDDERPKSPVIAGPPGARAGSSRWSRHSTVHRSLGMERSARVEARNRTFCTRHAEDPCAERSNRVRRARTRNPARRDPRSAPSDERAVRTHPPVRRRPSADAHTTPQTTQEKNSVSARPGGADSSQARKPVNASSDMANSTTRPPEKHSTTRWSV